MRRAFLANNQRELSDLLDRPQARTRSMMTPLAPVVYQADQIPTSTTFYADVHWPIESGMVARAAQLLPSVSFTHSGSGAADYVKIAVGVKRKGKFDVMGREFDSRSRDLVAGLPLLLFGPVLGNVEVGIPIGAGFVVRVVFIGTLQPLVLTSSVETFFGYEGG